MSRFRRQQPWLIRLTHWLNVPLIAIMAGSGLQILVAYPAMGPRGRLFGWYPFQHQPPPEVLRIGGWLAGARHWHFAFGWLLVLNGLVYVGYLVFSGQIRHRVFVPPRDAKSALRTAGAYLRFRRAPEPADLYNGLQLLAYTSALILGAVVVLTGLSLYKPLQLHWLASLFGGYDAARAIHLLCLAALALFTLGHVTMVLLHPMSFVAMITGGPREPRPPAKWRAPLSKPAEAPR